MSKSYTNSPFMSLPAGPRVQIYREVMLQEAAIPVEESVHLPSRALSAVCKQIRHEAEDVFWGENTFHSSANDANLKPAVLWLAKIGVEKASLIRTFAIEYNHSYGAASSILPVFAIPMASATDPWSRFSARFIDRTTTK